MTVRLRQRLPLIAAALVALGVLAMLLVPQHVDGPITWLSSRGLLGRTAAFGTPLWWTLENLANVALFAPLGYCIARWTGRPGFALLLGVLVSSACEFAQRWIPQRHSSLLDVGMNAVGVGVGVAVFLLVHRSRRTRTTPSEA